MAVTYNISVSPTLDEQKAKQTVENLKKAFNDGKVDLSKENITGVKLTQSEFDVLVKDGIFVQKKLGNSRKNSNQNKECCKRYKNNPKSCPIR